MNCGSNNCNSNNSGNRKCNDDSKPSIPQNDVRVSRKDMIEKVMSLNSSMDASVLRAMDVYDLMNTYDKISRWQEQQKVQNLMRWCANGGMVGKA